MLDYCSIILTVHAALWVGGRRVHWYMSAAPPCRWSQARKSKRERERGEDAEKCEHGEGHGRRGAVKKH